MGLYFRNSRGLTLLFDIFLHFYGSVNWGLMGKYSSSSIFNHLIRADHRQPPWESPFGIEVHAPYSRENFHSLLGISLTMRTLTFNWYCCCSSCSRKISPPVTDVLLGGELLGPCFEGILLAFQTIKLGTQSHAVSKPQWLQRLSDYQSENLFGYNSVGFPNWHCPNSTLLSSTWKVAFSGFVCLPTYWQGIIKEVVVNALFSLA